MVKASCNEVMSHSALCCVSPFFMQQPWFIICYLDRKWLLATQLTAWSLGNHNSMGYSLATNSTLLTQSYIFVPCFDYNISEGPFHHAITIIIILIIICPSTLSLARESPCWLSEVIQLFSLEQPSFLEGLYLQKTQHSVVQSTLLAK